MGLDEVGYCGLRTNINGKIQGPTKTRAKLHAYYDNNPTNCCASWFCSAATGIGYPEYTSFQDCEKNTLNYSVFFYGCNFNCLFCQNSSHKSELHLVDYTEISTTLKKGLNKDVTCICYFGGSPEPHFPFAINLSEQLLNQNNRIYRICWEWNGAGNEEMVQKAAQLSLKSGGTVKFDLKAYSPLIANALLGISPYTLKRVYKNFKNVAKIAEKRPNSPLINGCTLLVPYYIDKIEVEKIAKFIAEINPEIPYSMLVFHPSLFLKDLPITPRDQVKNCYEVAKKYLKNVHIGNLNLIGARNISDLFS